MSPGYVRFAGVQDTSTIAHLRQAWTEEHAGRAIDDPSFEETFSKWFHGEQSQRVTWLVEVDGRAVGMLNMLVFTRMPRPRAVGLLDRRTQWGYVANVYVVEAHRGEGLGGQLVDAATTFADFHQFARLVLSPSEPSRRLYERAGFGPATTLMVRTPPA